MKIRSLLLFMVLAVHAAFADVQLKTVYPIITSLDDITDRMEVCIVSDYTITVDDEGTPKPFGQIFSYRNGVYLRATYNAPQTQATPIMMNLFFADWTARHVFPSCKIANKTYFLNNNAQGNPTLKQVTLESDEPDYDYLSDNGMTGWILNVDESHGVYITDPNSRQELVFYYAGDDAFSIAFQPSGDVQTFPAYLAKNEQSQIIAQKPVIRLDSHGIIESIDGLDGAEIYYRMRPAADTQALPKRAAADASEWKIWNRAEWLNSLADITSDQMFDAKYVSGNYESEISSVPVNSGVITGRAESLIDIPATDTEYFDLTGRPIQLTEARGIVIARTGNQYRKIILNN